MTILPKKKQNSTKVDSSDDPNSNNTAAAGGASTSSNSAILSTTNASATAETASTANSFGVRRPIHHSETADADAGLLGGPHRKRAAGATATTGVSGLASSIQSNVSTGNRSDRSSPHRTLRRSNRGSSYSCSSKPPTPLSPLMTVSGSNLNAAGSNACPNPSSSPVASVRNRRSSPDNSNESAGGYNSEDEYEQQAQISDALAEELERKFEEKLQKSKGLYVKKMKEDGACLFRAVADQIYGDQEMHGVVRKLCMDYIAKNADYFMQFVTEDLTEYIARKRADNAHGNHVEMQAMAELFNRPIQVFQYSCEPINTFHSAYETENPAIRLSYHRNIHYNSVVDPYAATIGVGLGLPQFYPGAADKNLLREAARASEEIEIERAMLEDKLRATDWEATDEQMREQAARESYLQWLRDQEKQMKENAVNARDGVCTTTTKSDLSCAVVDSGQPSISASPSCSKSLPREDNSDRACTSSSLASTSRSCYQAIQNSAFGLKSWENDDLLSQVLALSQQEYFDSLKKHHRVEDGK